MKKNYGRVGSVWGGGARDGSARLGAGWKLAKCGAPSWNEAEMLFCAEIASPRADDAVVARVVLKTHVDPHMVQRAAHLRGAERRERQK